MARWACVREGNSHPEQVRRRGRSPRASRRTESSRRVSSRGAIRWRFGRTWRQALAQVPPERRPWSGQTLPWRAGKRNALLARQRFDALPW